MEVRVARSADADRLSGLIGVMGYAVSSELVEGKLADLGDDHRVLDVAVARAAPTFP